jgi:hypothetical protein
MKKLKAWQIVLLVIFYPVGICVLIYRLVKKSKLKREAAERVAEREAQARARAEAAERASRYEIFTFKIAGVTYKNADRHSRQAILRRLKFGDPPFDSGTIELELKEYEYEGEPAVGVYLAGEQVGNIAKDDLDTLLPRIDRFVDCISYDVTGGGQRNGEKLNYGLKLSLRFERA